MSPRPMRVLVTGAASGIGLGIARHFAERGHAVWLSDRDAGALGQAAAAARELGWNATGLELDVTSAERIDAAVAAIGPQGVDLLVNNAGLQHVAPLDEFPRERWELLVAVMLTGAAMLTRALLPGMRQRGFGRMSADFSGMPPPPLHAAPLLPTDFPTARRRKVTSASRDRPDGADAEGGVAAVSYDDDVHPYSDLALGRVDAVLLDHVLAEKAMRRERGLVTQPDAVAVRGRHQEHQAEGVLAQALVDQHHRNGQLLARSHRVLQAVQQDAHASLDLVACYRERDLGHGNAGWIEGAGRAQPRRPGRERVGRPVSGAGSDRPRAAPRAGGTAASNTAGGCRASSTKRPGWRACRRSSSQSKTNAWSGAPARRARLAIRRRTSGLAMS